MYCQEAFREELRKDTIRNINDGWNKELTDTFPEPHDTREVWMGFKHYFELAFKEKEEDGLLTDTTKKPANSATELTDIRARLVDLENENAHLESAFSAMSLNQQEYTPTPSYTQGTNPGDVPKTVGTVSDDTVTALTTAMSSPDMKQLFATLMRDEINKAMPTGRQGTGKPRQGWDQWKYWCHTHGTNLTHNSNNCDKPRPGHKTEATKANPMGGNTRKDQVWMKYCHPTTFKAHDQPTE
jgi:hypothetical protein